MMYCNIVFILTICWGFAWILDLLCFLLTFVIVRNFLDFNLFRNLWNSEADQVEPTSGPHARLSLPHAPGARMA